MVLKQLSEGGTILSETNIDVRPATELSPCGTSDHEDCGLRLVLGRLGERWTVMTLAELSAGPRRYRELERALHGISQRMMTLTLRRLERDGHVTRHVAATVPPAVTYECTEQGRSFSQAVSALSNWSRAHMDSIETSRIRYDDEQKNLD